MSRIKAPVKVDRKTRKARPASKHILSASLGERIRLLCQELGTTFIKLGQILSLRSDIIPESISRELRKLQDDIAGFSAEQVDAIFLQEFGRSVGELFSEFDYDPIAAASIAQVHRARFQGPDAAGQVAVKIQRPGIGDIIETDIEILADIALLIERHLPGLRAYKPVELSREFARTIRLELDFNHEGRNIELFRDKFSGDETVRIPKVYWSLTREHVLTMEHIPGIKLTELEGERAIGFDKQTIAVNGARMVLKQIFDLGFFHADPHPGNILVLEGNVIAPVDFGMVGFIDIRLREQLSMALSAFVSRDVDKLLRVFSDVQMIDEGTDQTALRRDLNDLVHNYYNMPLSHMNVGRILRELSTIIRDHHISLPSEFALMTKALITAESLGKELDPEFDLVGLARPFVRRLILSRLDPRRNIEQLGEALSETLHLMRDVPVETRSVLRKLQSGRLKFQFEHRGLEGFISEIDRSLNRLAFSIVVAAVTIGSSLILRLDQGPRILGLPAFGLLGFSLAGISGLFLIVAIIRSGRL